MKLQIDKRWKYLSFDEDEASFLYEAKPTIRKGDSIWSLQQDTECVEIHLVDVFDIEWPEYNVPWYESIWEREDDEWILMKP